MSLSLQARKKLIGINNCVDWLEKPVPFYEVEENIDIYDPSRFNAGEIEKNYIFERPTTSAVIDFVKKYNKKKVLDVGCGAGAFYDLLSKNAPEILYTGIDLSEGQIKRAKKVFGEGLFYQKDASEIAAEEFSEYDAVHIFSVLAFMSVEKQLKTLNNILKSNAVLVTHLTVTKPDTDHTPQNLLVNFRKGTINNKPLLTAVAFPYLHQVEELVSGFKEYQMEFQETTEYSYKYINQTDRDGGALLNNNSLMRRRIKLGHRIFPDSKCYKYIIKPKNLDLNYDKYKPL